MTEKIEKYVLTVMPDVCDANGKDPKATELLEKMKLYGKVEPYEKVMESVVAEYQEALGNLRAQNAAIKEQELTDDELLWLNFIRARKAANGEVYQARITELEQVILDISGKYKKRLAQFAAIIEQDNEE